MGGLRAVGVLRVLHSGQRKVLADLAAQGDSQCLDAAANAEDGQLTVIGQTGDEQFRQVALLVDGMQSRDRLLTGVERVDVTPSAEDECIQVVERVHEHGLVGHGGDDDGYSAGSDD